MDGPDPRLVQQLRDLHFPEPPSSWLHAPGWWITSLIVFIAFIVAARWWQQRLTKKSSTPTDELQSVFRHWQQHKDNARYLHEVNTLLRCYALRRDGRVAIARLQGTAWQRWLNAETSSGSASHNTSALPPSTLRALTLECYQAEPDTPVETVHKDINQWLRRQPPGPPSATETQGV